MPLDLLREEQARIEAEELKPTGLSKSAIVHFDVIESKLDRALTMLKDCQATYRAANRHVRRNLNQQFFEAIYVFNGMVTAVDLADPFRQILAALLGLRSNPERRDQSRSIFASSVSNARTEEA